VKRDMLRSWTAMAGRVKRYHTWPVLHQESVAEHSWRAAMLYCELFGTPRAEVMYYLLTHDCGELKAGDPPFPVKLEHPAYAQAHAEAEAAGKQLLGVVHPELLDLSSSELGLCKVCDMLQMLEFGAMELAMGNRFAGPIVGDTLVWVRQILPGLTHGHGDAIRRFIDARVAPLIKDMEIEEGD